MQASLHCYQKFNGKSQGYSHRTQDESRIQQCLPNQIKMKCPISKIIRLVNNLLKFNMFESALFCWLLKKSHSTFISKLELFQQDDLSKIKIINQDFQKRVFLTLLLNGYYVKTNFIANGSQIEVDSNILQAVPIFRQLYKSWKPQKSIKNINLTQINKIYQSWNHTNKTSSFVSNKVDYNKIVDKILFLSKTYNVSGNCVDQTVSVKDTNTQQFKFNNNINNNNKKQQLQQQPNKKRKLNNNEKSQQQLNIRYCEQKDIPFVQTSPMKHSGNNNKFAWFEEDKNIDLNPLRRSTRGMMNRSIFQIREDKDDINPNESLFRSFRSHDSDNNNMLNSLRNTGQNKFFNMNNSLLLQSNNQSHAFGNMFKSSLESDFNPLGETVHNMKTSSTKNKKQEKKVKLKPTTSYDDLIK